MARIYLSPPDVRPQDREFLLAAVESGWIAPAGPDLDAFEVEVAKACGSAYSVALNSGTAALHLSLLLAGVRPGDDVLLPSLTFAATANAAVYCGARPCLIDSEDRTWGMSPDLLAAELAERRRRNELPAAVVVVDLYGQCADYDAILPVCEKLGIPVIEDAAEALGATWRDRAAGSLGRFGVLSFNGNKLITTSGGGALITSDETVATRARYLASQARQPASHYEHTEVGFNYRLSNLLAAFGRGQLATLAERISRRREVRDCYARALEDAPGVSFLGEDPRGKSNAWLTVMILDGDAPVSAEEVRVHLEASDIESRRVWKPMHLQQVYAGNPARLDDTSERLFATGLCLPSGSGMSDADLERVINVLQRQLVR